jgi:adenine-specific DNA glycosylase
MRKKNPTKEAEAAVERAAARSAATVRRLLLAAYDAGKRSLPWRGETDPYRIGVSEVMLQQTRVETVIPYYGRWLERFPDIETLAAAEEAPALEAARRLATDLGLKVGKDSVELEMITHLFSHLKVLYWPFLFVVEGWRGQPVELAGNRWVLESDLDEVPLPVAQGRILQEAMERSQP